MQLHRIALSALISSVAIGASTLVPLGEASASTEVRPASMELRASTLPATLVSDVEIGPRLRELTMDSPAMGGAVKARLLVPVGWDEAPDRPRPVLYLLHGANGNEASWTRMPGLEEIFAPHDVLVIMPDGGKAGFYSDWYNNGSGGAPAYETHHLVELKQILEERFHANGRYAVTGASMGGFGTMSYAARHPDMFAAASSISGALDVGMADPLSLQSLAGISGMAAPIDLTSVWGPKDAGEVRWRAHNPADLASNLDEVELRVGSGNGVPRRDELDEDRLSLVTTLEAGTWAMSRSFVRRLHHFDVPVTTDFYGRGLHTGPYFRGQLERSLPMLTEALAEDRPVPTTFRYRSGEPSFSVWGWEIATTWSEPTFTDMVVDADNLRMAGKGEVSVTTPPKYEPGNTYHVSSRRVTEQVVADASGRLTFTLDLGDTAREYHENLRDRAAKRPLLGVSVTISPA